MKRNRLLSIILCLSLLMSIGPFVPLESAAESDNDKYSVLEVDASVFDELGIDPDSMDDRLMGDFDNDGTITAAEARIALRTSARLETGLTSEQLYILDMDQNGEVQANDARTILRMSARLESVIIISVKHGQQNELPEIDPEKVVKYENGDYIYSVSKENLVYDRNAKIDFYNNLINVYTFENLSENECSLLASSVGGTLAGKLSGSINMFQILVPPSDYTSLNETCTLLMQSDDVLYSHAEIPFNADNSAYDSDPWNETASEPIDDKNKKNADGNDWWAEAIGAYSAWEKTDEVLKDIKVGVMDNGFYLGHPDFEGEIEMLSGYLDEIDFGPQVNPNHGTHVSGLISAKNNNIGMRGVCNSASLICVDRTAGVITDTDYNTATKHLIESGCKVINNSFGQFLLSEKKFKQNQDLIDKYKTYDEYNTYQVGMSRAISLSFMVSIIELLLQGKDDFIVIQCAGNGFDNGGPGYDAQFFGGYCGFTEELFESLHEKTKAQLKKAKINYNTIKNHVMIVGATDNNKTIDDTTYLVSDSSNIGPSVDIFAPGEHIYSTVFNQETNQFTWDFMSGTSMAAPIVTGSVALLWAIEPNLSAFKIKEYLCKKTSCRAATISSDNIASFYPALNIASSVDALLQDITTNVSGMVKDGDSKSPLCDVAVTLTDRPKNITYDTKTDDTGVFEITVPHGNYSVDFSKDGYEKCVISLALDEDNVILSEAVLMEPKKNTSGDFLYGDGTEENPYRVSTPEQLDAVRNDLSAHYIQTADIDMSGFNNWIPIGSGNPLYKITMNSPKTQESLFTGSFDGNNHEISNLNIISINPDPYYDCYGLFGKTKSATLKNIRVDTTITINRSVIDYKAIWDEYGWTISVCAGGIVGCSIDSTISNCTVNGSIDVSHCYYAYIGGICGTGNPEGCVNNCSINVLADSAGRYEFGSNVFCGGITGRSNSTKGEIKKCKNTGDISAAANNFIHLGGISGRNGSIYDCVNTGNLRGITMDSHGVSGGEGNTSVGGIISYSIGLIERCVNYGNIYASSTCYQHGVNKYLDVGGIGGVASDVNNCYNKNNVISATTSVVDQIKDNYSVSSKWARIRCVSDDSNINYSSDETKIILDGIDVGIAGRRSFDEIKPASGGGITLSTDAFLKQQTYKDFDFDNVWYINPRLGGADLQSTAPVNTCIWGDLNGDGAADFSDILIINKYRLGKTDLTEDQKLIGDVNLDGKLDFEDILQINKYRLGKIQKFPSDDAAEFAFHAPEKRSYICGETLELEDMWLTVTNKNNPDVKYVVKDGLTVSGYDENKIGKQEITVSFRWLTYSFSVIVK